ncbi:MAG TPA: hypothetical protein VKY27_00505 [Bacteriovoracaceae bacterium]|nr:hypothetical protein [Bacteriovoracaceae bacterium]
MKNKINSRMLLVLALGLVGVQAQAQNINTLNSESSPLNSGSGTTDTVAQSSQTQNQAAGTNYMPRLSTKMPQKSLSSTILSNTFLTYYQQFLGPTLAGSGSETYNVFQEAMDEPGTGRAPVQSFHSVNLRYRINNDWSVGASLAATNGYTKEVENQASWGKFQNKPDNEFFNARVYANLPAWRTSIGTLWSTVAYEAPTSVTSRNNGMIGGLVISESFSFNLPSFKWSVGILGQYYRAYYDENVTKTPGYLPFNKQTVIISGGPYVNYRINDNWMIGSIVTFDWDQRGRQTDTLEFNNNLPHRGRLSLNYFPTSLKYLTNVGVFAQALLKFRPETTAIGADFAIRF